MATTRITFLGSLIVLHKDNPPEQEIMHRLELLLWAPLPEVGVIEAWSGTSKDEINWRQIA